MKFSTLFKLLFLLALAFLFLYKATDAKFQHVHQHHSPYEFEVIHGEYIVIFNEYLWISKHEELLKGIVGKEFCNSFEVVKRQNPSTEKFPSDFALVKVKDLRLLDVLQHSTKVKHVIPHHKVMVHEPITTTIEPESNSAFTPFSSQNGVDSNVAVPYSPSFLSQLSSHICFSNFTIYCPNYHHHFHSKDLEKSPGRRLNQVVSELSSFQQGRKQTDWLMNSKADEDISTVFSTRRKLCMNEDVPDKLGAFQLWEKGFTGAGVKVAVFDTGLKEKHPSIKNIEERINYTSEDSADDELGHGTFVAGIISSKGPECKGLAPDAKIYVFKVFNSEQVSYTSWFLDAFNYAINIRVNILNLSIGGPDYMDLPFVEKVWELSANNIIVISAIGNDGPLYGTLSSPAELSAVIGVGGIDDTDNIASFSSRGVTTVELASGGYGRVKPDIVTYGSRVRGTGRYGECNVLSGTSVASPVITGAVTLLASALPESVRWLVLNPASMKQILHEGAEKIPNANMYEQGAGKLNIINSYKALTEYKPKATLFPPKLDFTNCPYNWPFCSQPLYYGAMPIPFNITVLNGMGVTGKISEPPKWIPGPNGNMIRVSFSYSKILWPFSGHIAMTIEVTELGRFFEGVVEGAFEVVITSPPSITEKEPRVSKVRFEVKLPIINPPLRQLRILWDQYHNIQYPPGYVPRDNLSVKDKILDWNGDHVHTNFRDLFMYLRGKGYFIEVLTKDFTSFDARKYGTLMIVDPEEEFEEREREKLVADVEKRGLSVIVMGEWYNPQIMKKLEFFDDNTQMDWTPITGGANLPALNGLLEPFGIAFGDKIYDGDVVVGEKRFSYASGTHIIRFPQEGSIIKFKLRDQSASVLNRVKKDKIVPVIGLTQYGKGRLVTFGDSSCVDSAQEVEKCYWLMDYFLQYATSKKISDELAKLPNYSVLEEEFFEEGEDLPERIQDTQFFKYSKASPQHVVTAIPFRLINNSSSNFNLTQILSERPMRWTQRTLYIPLMLMFVILVFLIFMSMKAKRRVVAATEAASTRLEASKTTHVV